MLRASSSPGHTSLSSSYNYARSMAATILSSCSGLTLKSAANVRNGSKADIGTSSEFRTFRVVLLQLCRNGFPTDNPLAASALVFRSRSTRWELLLAAHRAIGSQ